MPTLVIDARSQVPVYLQIMDQIRGRIADGTLEAGSPLPPVRQLASDLGLNSNTVARAYSLLEREGTLRTAGRRGTFVANEAVTSVRRALHTDLERVVDQTLERAASLGVEGPALLEALRARLDRSSKRSSS